MENLISKTAACFHACNDCFMECLEEEHVKIMRRCIRLCKECAQVCGMTLDLLSDDSYFIKHTLNLCMLVCRECGDECRWHPEESCQKAARACDACRQACERFLLQARRGTA